MAIEDDENTEAGLERTQSADRSGEHEADQNVERLEKGTAVGRYLVLGPLGKGGMGVVYAAYDPELDRKVALKLVRVGGGDEGTGTVRLTREAQAMAKVEHPNVVAVHEVGSWYGRVFLAMELVDGTTLSQWLKAERRPWAQVLEMFVAAGQGLAAAHAAGLVHRDFKPDNVLVGKDGRARVTDFGLVRPASDQSGPQATAPGGLSANAAAVTQAGVVMGTPAFMAPEQMEGAPATAAADQFAFAVSLYDALYGEKPFAGATLKELHAQIRANALRPAPPRSRVPAYLRRVLSRALQSEVSLRFSSMEQLLAALQNDPYRRLRRALGVAAVVTAVLAGPAFVAQRAWSQAHRCDHVERELDGIWDPPRRTRLEQRVIQVGDPSASLWVVQWLDDYARLWTSERHRACESERVGREDPRLTASRNACVERRLVRLAATVDMLLAKDVAGLSDVRRAFKRIGMVKACEGDLPLPRGAGPNPDAVQMQARVNRAEALAALGQRDEAQKQASDIAQWAQDAGEHRLASEAFAALAQAYDDRQTNPRTVEALKKALLEAEASHEDEQVFDMRLELASAQVYSAGDFDQALWNLDQAEATLQRLALPKERAADLYRRRAALLEQADQPKRALPYAERALELISSTTREEYELTDERFMLANLKSDLGDIVGSEPIYEQVLEGERAHREPPSEMVHTELYVAEELVLLGRYADSLPHFEKATVDASGIWQMVDKAYGDAWKARALAALGEREKAARALAESDADRSAVNRPDTLAEVSLERAWVALLEARYDEAGVLLQSGLKALEPVAATNQALLLQLVQLDVERLRRQGKPQAAFDRLSPHEAAFAALDDTVEGIELRAALDELRLELGQKVAPERFAEAVELIEKNEGPKSASLLIPLLGLARASGADEAAARAALDRAAEVASHTPGDRDAAAEIDAAQKKLRR